jgi:hypothetical protein
VGLEQPYFERLRRVYSTGEPFSQVEALAWHEIQGGKVETYWDSSTFPYTTTRARARG